MPQNKAAFVEAQSQALVVKNAPYHPPGPHEVVIKNHAVAINPVDWQMRDMGVFIESYPTVVGCDVAGVVHAVGRKVTAFQAGDRVAAQALCLSLGPKYAAFQSYVPCPESLICKIPGDLSFEKACVMPLCVNTASLALFLPENLNLSAPSVDQRPSKQTVLIYGGSTGVGSSAIQLAKAAGASVITTAGKANHEYCTKLGADHVLDYKNSDWIDQVVSLLDGRELTGIFDTIASAASLKPIAELVSRLSTRPPIATTLPPPQNLKTNLVFGADIVYDERLPKAIWSDFLPKALEQGTFVPKPDPVSAGTGLENIQAGMDMQRQGVSARKVVVALL